MFDATFFGIMSLFLSYSGTSAAQAVVSISEKAVLYVLEIGANISTNLSGFSMCV